MMGSPASTAAYLMNTSQWDTGAETYLRKVIHEGQGRGSGGVPSVFPMPVFETTWVLSTLFQGTFSVDTLDKKHLDRITSYLRNLFNRQKGLLGFAPSVLADADDTAKTILTLNHQGEQVDPGQMITHFKTKQNHFCTYPGERNASFSANCNVLQALLSCHNVQDYSLQISSVTIFLCDSWWGGAVLDKWNQSSQYSMMLLSAALIRLLEFCDQGVLDLSAALLIDQIPVVLTQIANRTLFTQSATGAWGIEELPEVTAYSVLTLAAVFTIPWMMPLKGQIESAMQEGQKFLLRTRGDWDKPRHLWIEKVTYGSRNLSEAYCLAATRASISSHAWSERIMNLVNVTERSISKISKLFSSLTIFHDEPLWRFEASAIEGYSFLPLLNSARIDILPRQQGAKNKYLDFIPCTWVFINNHRRLFLHANLLWDMMVLTVCNFRVDEYMETQVAKLGADRLDLVKSAVRTLCAPQNANGIQVRKRPHEDSVRAVHDTSQYYEDNATNEISDLANFKAIIGHYINAMLDYPRIQQASSSDRMHLRSELQTFLLSHISQIADNARFSTQKPQFQSITAVFASPRMSYYEWAHTVGADSVSCPFAYAFFTCLLGSLLSSSSYPAYCFSSIHQTYLARDLCGHLATMSRLYNDYGSFARDHAEANVNSTNFPEFHDPDIHFHSTSYGEERLAIEETRLKADLLALARYERENADSVADKLLERLRMSGSSKDRTKADGIALFVGVTALYADMYVERDLSNQI
ncbi:MAG: hypothetical protein Q9161_009791 [Pseudevernia consocians]